MDRKRRGKERERRYSGRTELSACPPKQREPVAGRSSFSPAARLERVLHVPLRPVQLPANRRVELLEAERNPCPRSPHTAEVRGATRFPQVSTVGEPLMRLLC
jgi:hypothetical protein